MKVVSDSGPLIALGKLGLTGLLRQLYERVLIPSAVFEEAVTRGLERGEPDALATQLAIVRGEIQVISLSDEDLLEEFQRLKLDSGERQAIFLAHREKADWLVIDEKLARRFARTWHIVVKGTLGVLIEAYRKNLLTQTELTTVLRVLDERNDIWLDRVLLRQVEAQILLNSSS